MRSASSGAFGQHERAERHPGHRRGGQSPARRAEHRRPAPLAGQRQRVDDDAGHGAVRHRRHRPERGRQRSGAAISANPKPVADCTNAADRHAGEGDRDLRAHRMRSERWAPNHSLWRRMSVSASVPRLDP